MQVGQNRGDRNHLQAARKSSGRRPPSKLAQFGGKLALFETNLASWLVYLGGPVGPCPPPSKLAQFEGKLTQFETSLACLPRGAPSSKLARFGSQEYVTVPI